jgi:hypothetical protein
MLGVSRQFDYSFIDDDVVIIEDSDAEETYLSQVSHLFLGAQFLVLLRTNIYRTYCGLVF